MTPQEREARLRAARRMQDDIYQGIGATDRPDVDGRAPTSAAGGRMRDEARDSATSMTRAGTQPLRDLLAQPDDRTARMAARHGHFMPASLLDSQLATLEDPSGEAGVVTVGIDAAVETIVARALDGLKTVG